MNSLSKIALLATLFTVPFAGFAMEGGESTGYDKAGKIGLIGLGVAVASYGVYKFGSWAFGKKATETTPVNPQADKLTKAEKRDLAQGKAPQTVQASPEKVLTKAEKRALAKANQPK